MIDVRVSTSGNLTVIELLSGRAKNWYADNVDGAPAVSSNSLVMDSGPAQRIVRRMIKARLTVGNTDPDL